MLSAFLLFVVLSGAALWDLRTGKIPNRWLLFGVGIRVCLIWLPVWRRGLRPGEAAILTIACLLSMTIFLIFLFPLFLFRMIGAGDCKLMALIGGYLGISGGTLAIFYGFMAAAFWSLPSLFHKKIMKKRLRYFVSYVRETFGTGRITPYYDADRDGQEAAFSLAPFLWCGCLLWFAGQMGGIG